MYIPRQSDQALQAAAEFIIENRFKETYNGASLSEIFKAVFESGPKLKLHMGYEYLEVLNAMPTAREKFRESSPQDERGLDRSRDSFWLKWNVVDRFRSVQGVLGRSPTRRKGSQRHGRREL
jgi:hypothetical protein